VLVACITGSVRAQDGPPPCYLGICTTDCVKPIVIPDRWDDDSVPGSGGWANNGVWDSEIFTDTNGNGIWDPGEPFIDGSSMNSRSGHGPLDGLYNAEYYHPLNTGYVGWKDLGLELTFKQGSLSMFSLFYYPLALDSQTVTDYQESWSSCSPTKVSVGGTVQLASGDLRGPTAVELRDLINLDPGAYWDDGCQCVKSAMGDQSPRLIVICAYDPRILLSAGGQSLPVTKLIGFFLEASDANANLKAWFVTIQRPGNPCSNGGRFVVDCAVPTQPRTWGAVKASYR
jgi:hypothetical protein